MIPSPLQRSHSSSALDEYHAPTVPWRNSTFRFLAPPLQSGHLMNSRFVAPSTSMPDVADERDDREHSCEHHDRCDGAADHLPDAVGQPVQLEHQPKHLREGVTLVCRQVRDPERLEIPLVRLDALA